MRTNHHPTSYALAASQIDQYLARQRAQEPWAPVRVSPRPVITLSYAPGVPGREIAGRLARELDLHVFDREVLLQIERDTGLGEKIIAALDEGTRSALDAWIDGWVDRHHWMVDQKSFHHLVSRVIRGISLHGSAVIIGRGANFILAGAGAFRVRLIAPLDLRLRSVAEGIEEGSPMPAARARAEIERNAEDRARFIRKYFRAQIDDPAGYDAVFNLRRLDPDHAAGLIVDACRRTAGWR